MQKLIGGLSDKYISAEVEFKTYVIIDSTANQISNYLGRIKLQNGIKKFILIYNIALLTMKTPTKKHIIY